MSNKIDFGLKHNDLQFGLRRKRLVNTYSNTRDTLNSIRGHRGIGQNNYLDLSSYTQGDQLDDFFKIADVTNERSINLSSTLYERNLIYQKIINYYRDMYYWRYVITPRKIKITDMEIANYADTYAKMLEIADGLSVEVIFPLILLNLFKNGRVFIYANGDSTSKTVSTILLPNKYCRVGMKTQFGTAEVSFDLSFFDSFGLTGAEKTEFLSVFPKEFAIQYEKYTKSSKNSAARWVCLNPKLCTALSMNDSGFPTFLSLFYDIIDYKTYKLNELDRNTNKLERLVTQEIDLEKTGLALDEVEALHNSMADTICANRGSTLVTSVGKLNLLQLQPETSQQNDTLERAYNSIYSNAGINPSLFTGSIAESLDASVKRDLSFVWVFVEQLVNFYNLAINNIVNFKNYQFAMKVLPISIYNEKDKLEFYRQNAQYGVGIIDLMVASGIKQVDIESTLELEEFLDLTSRLVPLQSSHTVSSTRVSTDSANKKEEVKTTSTPTAKQSSDSNITEGDK